MKLKVAGKTNGLCLILTLIVVLLGAVVCNAAPISYSVNRTIGIGSVTGFIETDGSLGLLGAGNFVDWNLLLNDGTFTFDLTGPLGGNNSVVFDLGADTTATATQLLFNFSGSDNGLLLFQDGLFSGNTYYCDGTAGNFACFSGETVVANNVFTTFQNASRSGNVVIGTAGSAVPEPATLIMFGSGIVGLAGILRRKINLL
ncbi:MAG TPA: PEP-CTERM sorting domain-containing protein [Terriglobales bacterium]